MEETLNEIIISIRPDYCKSIFAGTKRYEYRRRIFKEKVKTLYIYESVTTRRVIGEVKVLGVLSGTPSEIWQKTKDKSGITSKEFYKYFTGNKPAYAIKLGKPVLYETPRTLMSFGISHAPMSFCYVKKESD